MKKRLLAGIMAGVMAESLLAGHCDRRGDRGGCAGGEIVQAQSQKDHKIKGGT